MLGLRNAIREDCAVSPAQMALGANLRLPNCFFEKPENKSSHEILIQVENAFKNFKTPPPVHNAADRDRPIRALQSATHVYVHLQGLKPSLTPHYQGPF